MLHQNGTADKQAARDWPECCPQLPTGALVLGSVSAAPGPLSVHSLQTSSVLWSSSWQGFPSALFKSHLLNLLRSLP